MEQNEQIWSINEINAGDLSINKLKAARRFAVQFLFQIEASGVYWYQERTLNDFISLHEVPEPIQEFLNKLVRASLERRKSTDEKITANLKNWTFDRIGKIELAILRTAYTELSLRKDVNKAAVIADAVDIAKRYGSQHSGGFVNGILDSLVK